MNMMKEMMIRKDTCYATNDNSAKKLYFICESFRNIKQFKVTGSENEPCRCLKLSLMLLTHGEPTSMTRYS